MPLYGIMIGHTIKPQKWDDEDM